HREEDACSPEESEKEQADRRLAACGWAQAANKQGQTQTRTLKAPPGLKARLLGSEGTDQGNLETRALRSLADAKYKEGENHYANEEHDPADHRHHSQKNALEGVEPHKRILVVGFDEKEDDCRDDRQVGNRTCGIVTQPGLAGLG